jgi:uncharacterized pyridoxal phosphate-containing UPF0001 family protein
MMHLDLGKMMNDSHEEKVVTNYREFVDQPIIQNFQKDGGKIHIATEGRTAEQIKVLQLQGHGCYSEKYVQEVTKKWTQELRTNHILHGYGNLQSNKASRACLLFDVIESVGRDSLLEKLKSLNIGGLEIPPICIQINLGEEAQKSGYLLKNADSAIEKSKLYGLTTVGVMAIPPKYENPVKYFRSLRQLADRHQLSECIMGMSSDYQSAIDEGSTLIRIGRKIFGN